MNEGPLALAIVYPGDLDARRLVTAANNRYAALFDAFAARGVQAQPAVYHRDALDALREQLLAVDGALVWVNPIESGHSRSPLDAVLRDVAAAGVFVSAHPDVILRLGTKDVLVDTRAMGWGSDVHRLDSVDQLYTALRERLRSGSVRVLKQWRGHSGIGVWRVERVPGGGDELQPASLVRARHAQRGSVETVMRFDAFIRLMAPYFDAGGHMVDQSWQPRLTEGMVRCYLVQDRVVGFGLQAVNALYPPPESVDADAAPTPGPRLYHPPDLPQAQGLKRRLETEWLPELGRTLGIDRGALPMLWDCDFLHADPAADGTERHVLCEVNASSVSPLPDSAIAPLVQATVGRLAEARAQRRGGRR